MPTSPEYDAAVVGGGFFGASLAYHLAHDRGDRVVLFEQSDALLGRASYANQARVHNGYHYPRSLLTALRCRINFPRFVDEFADCIHDDFEKTYAVARTASKVTAEQFRAFCERIGAPLAPAAPEVRKLFDADRIEAVFSARELCFDADRLRARMLDRLDAAGVTVETQAEVVAARPDDAGIALAWRRDGETRPTTASAVFNATYSRLNRLLVGSGRPPLRLKHELTEMPLVEVPPALARRGITVMCGPFFSLMPFPARGLHTLSHVRYTPHCEWTDDPAQPWLDPEVVLRERPRRTHFPHMVRDAARYVPALAECVQVDSLWEVKTVLPRSEVDDSRPVLYRRDDAMPGLVSVLGAKIDNIYDIVEVASGGLDRSVA